MDLNSMEASFVVAEMEKQHFNGGFLSEEVKAKFANIKDLETEQKQKLYADSFNYAYNLATELTSNEKYKDGELDLSSKGVGKISISFHTMSKEGLEGEGYENPVGYRMLSVRVDSFDPQSEAYTAYDPEDMLGDGSPYTAYRHQHPKFWDDGSNIALNDDGEQADDFLDLDTLIMLALDNIETLETAKQLSAQ